MRSSSRLEDGLRAGDPDERGRRGAPRLAVPVLRDEEDVALVGDRVARGVVHAARGGRVRGRSRGSR